MDSKAKYINCKNNIGEYEDVPIEKITFRPSAYGFVYDDGKIITLTNKSNGKIWFPGGGINLGEKMEDGLRREILEEAGIEVSVEKVMLFKENFFYYKPLGEGYHAFLFFYLCRPISRDLIDDDKVYDEESEKPRWTKIEDIKKEDLSDLSEDIFEVLESLK
jgi:8-oxo-dGTP pyrophosphatase MutT (NUDIX family)